MALLNYITFLSEGLDHIKRYSGNRNNIIKKVNDGSFYHGSPHLFDEFSLNKFGRSDDGWLGYGVYLTNDYTYANSYAVNHDNGYLYECQVNIKNPFILLDRLYSSRPSLLKNRLNVHNSPSATKLLKNKGYDSVLLLYQDGYGDNVTDFMEICIFNPKDISIQNKYYRGDEDEND
jgi:hypothetical protein